VYEGCRLIDDSALAQDLARTLGGNNAAWCDNITCVDTLLFHKPPPMTGGIDLYFMWPPRDRPEDEISGEVGGDACAAGGRRLALNGRSGVRPAPRVESPSRIV